MSATPCSAAARRIVWSESTSISMPTGSNRTWCLSPTGSASQPVDRTARVTGKGRADRPFPSPDPRSGALGCGASRRPLAVVVGDERRPLLVGHLVEEDVGAQDRAEP